MVIKRRTYCLIFQLLLVSLSAQSAEKISVAASANLSFVLPKLIEKFKQNTGINVNLTLGSTRSMTHQIIRGAPFEIFLSADEQAVELLQQADLQVDNSVIYARGQLCIFKGKHIESVINTSMTEIVTALETGLLNGFAIANPETAPYGRAARQVLLNQGVWTRMQEFLVFGENAAQAAQFAFSGAVDISLLPCSIVLTDKFRTKGQGMVISQSWYQPIIQSMLKLKGASPMAHRFFQYMETQQVQSVLQENGYLRP